MSALRIHQNRPLWRACLAIIAVVANMVLPAAWTQAVPLSTIFGDNFALCLANGGQNVTASSGHLPDDTAATDPHCSLCLFSGSVEAPSGTAVTIAIPSRRPPDISLGYTEPALAIQFRALRFEARAPPA